MLTTGGAWEGRRRRWFRGQYLSGFCRSKLLDQQPSRCAGNTGCDPGVQPERDTANPVLSLHPAVAAVPPSPRIGALKESIRAERTGAVETLWAEVSFLGRRDAFDRMPGRTRPQLPGHISLARRCINAHRHSPAHSREQRECPWACGRAKTHGGLWGSRGASEGMVLQTTAPSRSRLRPKRSRDR